MKEIRLTKGMVAIVDDEDFSFLNRWKWHAHESADGVFYAVRCFRFENKQYKCYMHRLITCAPEGAEVDHRNSNKLDNRRTNLRLCNREDNMHNSSPCKNGKSGYKGVSRKNDKGRTKPYRAVIRVNKRQVFLGYFKTAEEAALAYNNAAIKYFGEFAWLNIIPR